MGVWEKQFEVQIKELKDRNVHLTTVKCGKFYSIPQVSRFLDYVKHIEEKLRGYETKETE